MKFDESQAGFGVGWNIFRSLVKQTFMTRERLKVDIKAFIFLPSTFSADEKLSYFIPRFK